MKRKSVLLLVLAWVVLMVTPASHVGAAYPQTLTVNNPFVNLPRPTDDPRWGRAFAHWDKREDTDEVMAAMAIFEDLARSFPERFETRIWLVRSYNMAGNRRRGDERISWMKKAVAEADKILAVDPDNGFARYWRYSSLVLVRDFTPQEFKDLRQMARKYDQLREIVVPKDDQLWGKFLELWDQRLDVVKLDQAIALLETLEKKYPNRIEPKIWLSRANYWHHYHGTTDEEKAEWAWKGVEWGREAVELEPRNPAAQYWTAASLGQYATYTGYVAKARYAYEMATRLSVVGEEDMNYYYGGLSQYFALAIARGGALVAKSAELIGYSQDDILKLSRFAAEYEPRYLRNLYALGEMNLYLGKQEEAKQWLDRVVAADPKALPNYEADNVIAQRLAKKLLDENFGEGK